MKKIMFNDSYGLTEAVLQGRKTMTRRSITKYTYNCIDFKALNEGNNKCYEADGDWYDYRLAAYYKIGEIVAVAQSYANLNAQGLLLDDGKQTLANSKGWNSKMFVKADLMPHQIRIADVRIERLQDISDEDCLREGIEHISRGYVFDPMPNDVDDFRTPREAFAALIDIIGGKGTWGSNDYVWVYEFELVK